jgi:heat shock protein HslJ
MNKFHLYIPLLTLLAVSCSEMTSVDPDEILSQIDSTSWQLAYMNQDVIPEDLNEQNIPTIHFNAETMRISGGGGCNAYFGSFQIDRRSQFTVSELGSTLKLCPEIEIEKEYFSTLQNSEQISVTANGEILNLKDSQSQALLSYTRI